MCINTAVHTCGSLLENAVIVKCYTNAQSWFLLPILAISGWTRCRSGIFIQNRCLQQQQLNRREGESKRLFFILLFFSKCETQTVINGEMKMKNILFGVSALLFNLFFFILVSFTSLQSENALKAHGHTHVLMNAWDAPTGCSSSRHVHVCCCCFFPEYTLFMHLAPGVLCLTDSITSLTLVFIGCYGINMINTINMHFKDYFSTNLELHIHL